MGIVFGTTKNLKGHVILTSDVHDYTTDLVNQGILDRPVPFEFMELMNSYNIRITQQPLNQTCILNGASGYASWDINVDVMCYGNVYFIKKK